MPPGLPRVDFGDPIANGLVYAHCLGNAFNFELTGFAGLAALTGSPGIVQSPNGSAMKFTSSPATSLLNTNVTTLPTGAAVPWTLSQRVYCASAPGSGATFAGWAPSTAAVQSSTRYLIQFNSHIYFWGNSNDLDSGVAFDTNKWQLITITYDGTNLRIYKNAALIAGPTAKSFATSAQRFGISQLIAGFQTSCNALLDLVGIWKRALTPAEVASLAAQPFQFFVFPEDLVSAQLGKRASVLTTMAGDVSSYVLTGKAATLRPTLQAGAGSYT